jgi:hypothetical protein
VFNDTKYLTEPQKDICKALIKQSAASWIEIGMDDLNTYSWDKLITKTVNFIKKYEILYDEVIYKVWSTKEKRVSRLAWNTNGWVFPSGPYGKSNSPDSHEAKYGYGHEEWLFDTSKIIDGFHYGFLEPIRKQQDTYANKSYDVWLYTIDGVSKTRFWIGELKNVEVIDKDAADKIKEVYVNNGWLLEMEEQIISSGANKTGFSDWKGIDLFNVRFKKEDLIVKDPYFELPPNHPIYEQSRYAFVFFKEAFNPTPNTSTPFSFVSSPNNKPPDTTKPETRTFIRTPKSVEVLYLHKAIQERLVELLRKKHGRNNVTPEHPAFAGAKRVDIVVQDEDGKCIFVEIKTYNSAMTSIREAIGQLLEYAFWPDKTNAKELVIVTQKPQDIPELEVYFKHLRKSFNIPLYYQWFDLESNVLSNKI